MSYCTGETKADVERGKSRDSGSWREDDSRPSCRSEEKQMEPDKGKNRKLKKGICQDKSDNQLEEREKKNSSCRQGIILREKTKIAKKKES